MITQETTQTQPTAGRLWGGAPQFDMSIIVADDDFNDVAHRFGKEDALAGEPSVPEMYYPASSPACAVYVEGYEAGLTLRNLYHYDRAEAGAV